MINITLHSWGGQKPHLMQIFTGLSLLQKENIINVDIKKDWYQPFEKFNINIDKPICVMEVAGKKIAIDTLDGYNFQDYKSEAENLEILDGMLTEVDLYFKRSFSGKLNEQLQNKEKIRPLGLNYLLTCKNNVIGEAFKRGNDAASAIQYLKAKVSNMLQLKMEQFEKYPTLTSPEDCKVIFMTRLWYTDTSSQATNELNEYINRTRIETVKLCRKEFGSNFIGGLHIDGYSKDYPELWLNKKDTFRNNYLKKMHEADICLATTGLHNSIGWKFGEYVAAAKCIVSEPLRYELPGNFRKDQNYREAITADDFIKAIVDLRDNPAARFRMQYNNYKYYQNNLRPDMMMLNTLSQILD